MSIGVMVMYVCWKDLSKTMISDKIGYVCR